MNSVPGLGHHYLKSITCFLPRGRSQEVLERLRKEMGVNSAYVHHARGVGLLSAKRKRLFPTERTVLTVLVHSHQADEVFEFLYHVTGVGERGAGLIFMTKANMGELLMMPEDTPEES